MISINETAATKIVELLSEENDPTLHLRVFVQGGGCSGFQYGFTFDNEQNDDDFVIQVGCRSVLVDALSAQYLGEARVDFEDDLNGARFIINNPQAASTCGCGSSFSM